MLYCCNRAFQPLYNFYAHQEGAIYKKVEFHHCPNCKQAVYREKVLRYDNALIHNTFKGQKAEKMFKRAYSNRLIFKEKIKQGTKVKNNWFYGSFKNSNSKDEKGRVIQIQTKKNFNDETVAILGEAKIIYG